MKIQTVYRQTAKCTATLIAVFTGLMLQVAAAHAIGLGNMELKSALNAPLAAELQLTGVKDLSEDQIILTLGTAEDFARVGISRDFLYTKLKFAIVKDKTGGAMVKVTTDDVIQEPSLNFVLRLQSPEGSVTREYTLLLATPK